MQNPEFDLVSEFLNQDEWWVNKDGWLRIDEMNTTFRRRAAAMLLRRARFFVLATLEETYEDNSPESDYVQEFVGRVAAPTAFMRRTPLFKRIIQDGADPHRDWQDGDE